MAWGKAQAEKTLKAIIAQDSVQVYAGSGVINAAKSTLRRQDLPNWEGMIEEYRESVTVVKDDWPTEVKVGDTITVEGNTRRILNTEADSTGTGLRLDLGEKYAIQ